jgi:hypothetical protein
MMKNKTFDCVDMKNSIQKALWEEFQSRRSEFANYGEFIAAKANSSEFVRAWREKRARQAASPGDEAS